MLHPRLLAAALLAASLLPVTAGAQEQPVLSLELNKLEPVPAAAGAAPSCRAYIVVADADSGPKVDAMRLDLVLFGTDGVIARRIALDIGPIQPGRTQVRPFDLRDLACDGIGQILVNDTLICKIGGADQSDCLDRVKTSSRVSAKLAK